MGKTLSHARPHALIMEADGGARADSCPLLQQGWRLTISLCPRGVPTLQSTTFIPDDVS